MVNSKYFDYLVSAFITVSAV